MIGVIIVSLCVLGAPVPDRPTQEPAAPALDPGRGDRHRRRVHHPGGQCGGPLMALYLVAMRLPKMQFVGTARCFHGAQSVQVPFMVKLGLVTAQSFEFNLMLAPAVLLGAFAGRWLLIRINQRLFEQMVLGFSAIAGFLLIV
jgi:hypothetical protein